MLLWLLCTPRRSVVFFLHREYERQKERERERYRPIPLPSDKEWVGCVCHVYEVQYLTVSCISAIG